MALPALAILGGLAAAGGALSNIGGGLMGKPGKIKQAQRFTEPQRGALDQLLAQGMQNANFSGIESNARRNFQQRTIPSLMQRFASMPGNSGMRSSGFQGAMMGAGADLESQLGALRSQYGMQQLGMGLTPQFENYYTAAQPGMLQGGLQGLMSMMPMLGMSAMGYGSEQGPKGMPKVNPYTGFNRTPSSYASGPGFQLGGGYASY